MHVDLPSILVATAAVTLLAMIALWGVSLALGDVSIVDLYWGPGFAVIAFSALALGAGGTPRSSLIAGLVALWGIRLGLYLSWRNCGAGEDPRYQAIRRGFGDRFWLSSLAVVFLLQGVLMWIVSLPVQAAVVAVEPQSLVWLDAVGIVLWATGMLFETVGDWQLAAFKADPNNRGKVMDRGLWRHTRHPNYFGDFMVWWGCFAIALATPYGVWTVIGPLVITFLLLRVSGVSLLERSLVVTRPGYKEYVARTGAFFPWPPRRPVTPAQ